MMFSRESFVEFGEDEELEQSIADRFEKQVARNSGHLAIKTRKCTLSYEELNCAANAVARKIVSRRREKQEAVALLLENDAPMIEAILGVLKAGKIYVPLDAALPSSRLSHILQESEAGLLITNSRHSELAGSLAYGGIDVIDVDC